MKKFLLFIALFCSSFQAFAQQPCRVESNLNSADPAARAASQEYETTLQNWIQQHPNSASSTLTIPVVVHVVWQTAAQNISDAQVMSQIQVLNEDFGRTNADAVNTPSGFQPVAANTGIQFCLAQIDPQGNPTTGIEHIATTTANFDSNLDDVKHASTGGVDAWDVTRYFNIWVCNAGQYVGDGEIPTSTVSNTYGLVVRYNCFGSNYTSFGTFPNLMERDRGRLTTHLAGHSFNLLHIEFNSSCADSDFVADTPVASTLFSTCSTYPLLDACNPVPPGVMYMNYMVPYLVVDSCLNLFTIGQSARMNAVLNVPPYNTLATSTACGPASIATNSNPANLVSVFPNPSQDVFNVILDGIAAEKIILCDMLGNKMEEFSTRTNSNAIVIDLSYEANGAYFLQIITADNRVINKKIILSN